MTNRLQVEIKKQVKGFSLQVELEAAGGCLGILGASGCGKSMTLKSIAGLVQPDEGRISLAREEEAGGHVQIRETVFFDSFSRTSLPPQKRRVGYLFQSYALFPNMTVAQNIAAGLQGERRPPAEITGCVSELVRRFQLHGMENSYPRQLSGGQQQRVALARILAYKPDILLLDEPFSAMDAHLREGMRLELARIIRSYPGVVILVTHDRDEAYQLCDRMALLDEGSVLAAGDTREIFASPQTVQAARLTGCKNISRIQRLGDYRVRALDWGGLELTTAKRVGSKITAVGIRAHDFKPFTGENQDNGFNRIPVGTPAVSELPFEWYITLENGIWWKTRKDMLTHSPEGVIPEWLQVAPEKILLLE